MSNTKTPLEQLRYAEHKLEMAVDAMGATLNVPALWEAGNELKARLYRVRLFRLVLEAYPNAARIDYRVAYITPTATTPEFDYIILCDDKGDVFTDKSKFSKVFVATLNLLVAKDLFYNPSSETIMLNSLVRIA